MIDIQAAEAAVRSLLRALGEDADRDGLKHTPARVARAWAELLEGREQGAEVLTTSEGGIGFEVAYDEMIVMSAIPFVSVCEHHMLPFRGHADVAYIPDPSGKVVGASKLPRLVRAFSARLQIQERLTNEIAQTLNDVVGPLGVGVRISAEHLCCSARGVRSPSIMVTQALIGVFRKPEVREEFDRLCAHGRRQS